MTLFHNGKVVYPLPDELKHFQERDLKWLWRKLDNASQGHLGSDAGLSFYERTTRITTLIRGQPNPTGFVQQILADHSEQVIPRDQLQWIEKENERLLIWLAFQLIQVPDEGSPLWPPPVPPETGFAGFPFTRPLMVAGTGDSASLLNEGGTTVAPCAIRPTRLVTTAERFDEFLLAIDLWPETRDRKLNFLAGLKDRWARERTPPKESKWFNPEKYKQLDQATWAWEYLIRAKRACVIAPPSNQQELTAAVLASFDLFWRLTTAERTVFICQRRLKTDPLLV